MIIVSIVHQIRKSVIKQINDQAVLQNLRLYQQLEETSLVKTPTHREDFLDQQKKQHISLGPRKNMWHKLQGGPSSLVPMFTVAQMEHQLKSKMSLRSEFLFKIFVFNTIGLCNFSNFLCIIALNTPHPPILSRNFKKSARMVRWGILYIFNN